MAIFRHTFVLRTLQSIVATVLVLYSLIWLLSPWITRYVLTDVLAPLNLAVTEESHVRYNPFRSSVTIQNCALIHNENTIASIEQADIGIKLFRLLRDEVFIKKFEVNGIYLDVHVNDGVPSLGEYLLTSNSENEKDSDSQPENRLEKDVGSAAERDKEKSFIEKLSLLSSELVIRDVNIDLSMDGNDYPIILDVVSFEKFKASLSAVEFSHVLKATLLDGKLEYSIDGRLATEEQNIKMELETKLETKHLSLEQMSRLASLEFGSLSGGLDVAFASEITGNKESFDSKNSLSVALADVNYQYFDSLANLDNFTFNVVDSKVKFDQDTVKSVTLKATLGLDSLVAKNTKDTSEYLSLKSLGIPEITISASFEDENKMNAAIDQILFSDIQLSNKSNVVNEAAGGEANENSNEKATESEEKVQTPALVELAELSVNALNYTNDSLSVGDVTLTNLLSHVRIDENGDISTLVDFPQFEADAAEAEPELSQQANDMAQEVEDENKVKNSEPVTDDEVIAILVGKIALAGENTIYFQDKSVEPVYERVVHFDEFQIADLSSESSELSPFKLVGRSEEYANFSLSGGVSAFSEKRNFNMKGDVKEISLPGISSYVKDGLGFELNSGQLDTLIDVSSDDAELDGKITLSIRGLEMTSADNAESESLKDQSAVPLNVALGMLKDKRGNIKLDVPLSGSTDDPSFGVNSFLILVTKKAVMSQAKSYLMQTFVPYASVVSVAMAAGDFALKLRFDDLPYEPAQTDLSEAQAEYVQQFIALMKDKEKTQVKICGVATPVDISKPLGEKIEDEALVQAMLEIAEKRSEIFKRFVVEQGGVESSRLLLCQAQIDFSEKAQPHISIAL